MRSQERRKLKIEFPDTFFILMIQDDEKYFLTINQTVFIILRVEIRAS